MVDDDDGLNLNYENKIKLETIEKELEILKVVNCACVILLDFFKFL